MYVGPRHLGYEEMVRRKSQEDSRVKEMPKLNKMTQLMKLWLSFDYNTNE